MKTPELYHTLIYSQDYSDPDVEFLLDERDEPALARHLAQWDQGDGFTDEPEGMPWGQNGDTVSDHNVNGTGYVLSVNYAMGYAALHVKATRENTLGMYQHVFDGGDGSENKGPIVRELTATQAATYDGGDDSATDIMMAMIGRDCQDTADTTRRLVDLYHPDFMLKQFNPS